MFYIRNFSVVPYSVKQMFNLINDINAYKEFIPGCSIIKIIKQNHEELFAEIIPIRNGVIQSIITHNFFVQNKSIIIYLIKSPFKYFYGHWKFIPISQNVSSIEYISRYEFNSVFFGRIYNYYFQDMCKNIITIFTVRANQVYGIHQ